MQYRRAHEAGCMRQLHHPPGVGFGPQIQVQRGAALPSLQGYQDLCEGGEVDNTKKGEGRREEMHSSSTF